MSKNGPCPCTSGKAYGACCGPLHDGTREPQVAEEVVRSRYAAFALGNIAYLIKTQHADHPDRGKPAEQVELALRIASQTFKYMGLVIIETRAADRDGISQVLYLARIFRKGSDVSFVELADFLHGGTGLRYRNSKTMDASGMRVPPPELTIDSFKPTD